MIGQNVELAIKAWHEGRKEIIRHNRIVDELVAESGLSRESVDETRLPTLEEELKSLQATKRRHEPETLAAIQELEDHKATKVKLAEDKAGEKQKLNEHGRAITRTLGKTINSYLSRLNAGFKIDYKEPNYRGKEPAASYQILINDVPVPPRRTDENLAEASFRNTLSAGDKSTLAALRCFWRRSTRIRHWPTRSSCWTIPSRAR